MINNIDLTVQAVERDVIETATGHDPALTYYADGTPVTMIWVGGSRAGVTSGRTASSHRAYGFQRVTWPDGNTDLVAPHVLRRRGAVDHLKETRRG